MGRLTDSDLQAERECTMIDLLEKIAVLLDQQTEALQRIAGAIERMEDRQMRQYK